MVNTNSGLRNRYHLMAHGESQADRQAIINSDPAQRYQLTTRGMEQVAESIVGSRLRQLGGRALIYCSPFARTKQTALIASQLLEAALPRVNRLLAERDFGQLEGAEIANLSSVWEADRAVGVMPSGIQRLRQDGVELPTTVAQRVARLIAITEYRHRDEDLLLVSHPETLQITQAILSDLSPIQHRRLPPFELAEIRSLSL